MPASSHGQALSPAGESARRNDPDRFLAALAAPAARREHLFAVLAFEHEIARTREVVSDAMLGQIRLQWWDDAVAALADGGRPPVADPMPALADAVAAGGVTVAALLAMVEGRRQDLEEAPPETLEDLEAYARATGGAVGRALAEALGHEGPAAEPAIAVGTGWALAGILRALPYHARRNEVLLPTAALDAAGLTAHDIAGGRGGAALAAIVRDVAGAAEARFAAARAMRPARGLLPALLPARLARVHLARLARAGHDPFAPALRRPDGLRAARIGWGAWTGRWW
ncbi:phytoene synthase [Stella humosa]|uniref:Phytoene synthase n=1 Tax=Stella humosa TaxID=94 RepID=A0A3N1M830_9PROT|nr:squalene/phytoene synthase family protein [Stella humosa]ROP99867.1 phytoene synthase [Stella humosa]BBK30904.1 hypothetical protein STHU_15380 [Stella humosa]